MGDIELGTCQMCHKENTQVLRNYYYYDIDCECCNGDHHFEYIYHCPECKPKPARTITATVKPVEKNSKKLPVKSVPEDYAILFNTKNQFLFTQGGENIIVNLPKSVKSVLLQCKLEKDSLLIKNVEGYTTKAEGLIAYAEIPNPESQLCCGDTTEELLKEIRAFLSKKDTDTFLQMLRDTI